MDTEEQRGLPLKILISVACGRVLFKEERAHVCALSSLPIGYTISYMKDYHMKDF